MRDHREGERERFDFLIKRDGLDAALYFVQRTYKSYRKAVLNPAHFASSRNYKRCFIQACTELRRILNENKE